MSYWIKCLLDVLVGLVYCVHVPGCKICILMEMEGKLLSAYAALSTVMILSDTHSLLMGLSLAWTTTSYK